MNKRKSKGPEFRAVRAGRLALAALLALAAAGGAGAAPAAAADEAHAFKLWYRNFGTATSRARFETRVGFEIRFEGCWTRAVEEAVCGVTLRALEPLEVSNLDNFSHAEGPGGARLRTCCMFVEGDASGYPIRAPGQAEADVGRLHVQLGKGEERAFMIRIPDARRLGPVEAVVFSRGAGDKGERFVAHVEALGGASDR